jgi:hypothetical protein
MCGRNVATWVGPVILFETLKPIQLSRGRSTHTSPMWVVTPASTGDMAHPPRDLLAHR